MRLAESFYGQTSTRQKSGARGLCVYNNVSAKMSDRALAKGVLRMIAEGNRLAVQNLAGKNLASYSLRGSSAAMSAFTDCWNRLQPADEVKSDPFVDDKSDQTVKDTFD